MSKEGPRAILAMLGAIAADVLREPAPEPPDEFDPEHQLLCNVNLFRDGKCDCDVD